MMAMGANSRDRVWEADVRQRAREVRKLDAQGLALHLIVTGGRQFNDRSFVADVLDRIHHERGLASLCYCENMRATTFADRWARSRLVRVFWVDRREILQQRVHGVVAFDGPHYFIQRARAARLVVWEVRPVPYVWRAAPLGAGRDSSVAVPASLPAQDEAHDPLRQEI
jgi:hypothetical protein